MPAATRIGRYALAALGGAGLLVAIGYLLAGSAGADGHGGGYVFLGVLPLYVVAVFLLARRPEHPEVRWLVLMASAVAFEAGLVQVVHAVAGGPGLGEWFWLVNLVDQWLGVIAVAAAAAVLGFFPDGVPHRRWEAVAVRSLWALLVLPPLLLLTVPQLVVHPLLLDPAPVLPSPFAVPWLAPLGPPLESLFGSYEVFGALGVVLLLARYRRASVGERRPVRLLLATMVVVAAVLVAQLVMRAAGVPEGAFLYQVTVVLFIPAVFMISLSMVVGVLRYGLFDIQLAIRRSAVYAVLTVGIAGLYAVVAAAPGLALGRTIPVELAVLLTIVAAFAFQPLRRRLQMLADRFAFGERVNRYELLTGLGATLEQAVQLDELLPRLATTVRRGLGARWVRVALRDAEHDGWLAEPVGVAGDPRGAAVLVVSLERGEERIGRIECGEPEARPYTARDRELLVTLARQATPAIANVRLTAQLAQSRARIVAAGDAERRRIERDIHDGVQQQVVALLATIRLARNRVGRGDVPADEVLAALAADVRELLVDLRDLAHGIHPPVLSDRGLVSAVEERVRRLPVPATMHTEPELRTHRLPLAVEGASYYVICEAITNVIKHSGAASADISLCTENGLLTVDVRDDGAGFDPSARNGGAGITNIRDRVEALGGLLRVRSEPGGGTEVHAELPLAVHGG